VIIAGPTQLLPGHVCGRRQASLLVSLRPEPRAPLQDPAALACLQGLLQCWQAAAGQAPEDGAQQSTQQSTQQEPWLHWVDSLGAATVALLQGINLPLWDAPQRWLLPAPARGRGQPHWTQWLLPTVPGHTQASISAWQLTVRALQRCLAAGNSEQAAALFAAACQQLSPLALRGSNSPRLLRAAAELDVPVLALGGERFQYGQGRRAQWLESTFTLNTATIASQLARDKQAAAQRLRQAGLPVPDHHPVTTVREALRVARQLGYPVVVKPRDRDGGQGVAAGLRNEAELRAAFESARALSPSVLIEQHVEGRDYRLTVLDGELLWAVERIPAGITGDGVQSVAQLVAAENARPQRGTGSHALLKQLQLDGEAQQLLQHQGLDTQSVPPAGCFVRLRRIANVSTGGQPVAVNDQVHPDNARLAVRAAAALRLDLAGVDLLLPDIARSWREGGGAICEVNAQPQLGATTGPHLYAEILRRRLGGNGRIPVLALLGAPADDTLLDELLVALAPTGVGVGWCTRAGAGINQQWLSYAPHDSLASTRMLLTDAGVDLLVLSVQDDQLLRVGLPVDRIDCLVVAGAALQPASDAGAPGPPGSMTAQPGLLDKALAAMVLVCRGPVLLLPDSGLLPAQVETVLPAHCQLQRLSRAACVRQLMSCAAPSTPA